VKPLDEHWTKQLIKHARSEMIVTSLQVDDGGFRTGTGGGRQEARRRFHASCLFIK
jgi:hypothetical protein